jgi:two-component system chemotaxis response regulator CheB
MIKVLVADDSVTARELLVAILTSDPEICVIGEARHGQEAVELTQKLRPNVVTMDIRMPGMDGFAATKEIMITAPTPIVLVTASVAIEAMETSMHALRVGALAVFPKPPGPGSPGYEEAARQLVANVKALAQVKVVRHWRPTSSSKPTVSGPPRPTPRDRIKVVAIATSTGGPAALYSLLSALPGDFPVPILIVQHITPGFTLGLADWLNKVTDLRVKLAQDGEPLQPHTVYLAPDQVHLGVAGNRIALSTAPAIGGFRPSGTFLFQSVARVYSNSALAMILTGMGEDGVEGLRDLHKAGGRILAQDEKSSVIFGMPAAAIAAGLADQVLSLEAMPAYLLDMV